MGDRYYLALKCAYCKEDNDDVWYAPSCGAETFKCERCGRTNKIEMHFKAEKLRKK